MPDGSSIVLFALAALALLLMPGPAVLYIVTRSIDQGRGAGLVSVVGVGMGSMVHVVAAALGLSAVLLQSALAFRTVKYAGAAYLVYLGVRRLLGKGELAVEPTGSPRSLRRVFVQGVVVNILNPKTALFFLAFLPQFVNVGGAPIGFQILFLGTLMISMGIVTDGLYALAAGSIGGWLKRRPGVISGQRYVTGGILISLGLAAAFAGGKES
ncbi:MAG: LysE family translocator [Acidimicrobiia bacterium]|jgi:threonine/homoserine/homoserine lactone efflux protein